MSLPTFIVTRLAPHFPVIFFQKHDNGSGYYLEARVDLNRHLRAPHFRYTTDMHDVASAEDIPFFYSMRRAGEASVSDQISIQACANTHWSRITVRDPSTVIVFQWNWPVSVLSAASTRACFRFDVSRIEPN